MSDKAANDATVIISISTTLRTTIIYSINSAIVIPLEAAIDPTKSIPIDAAVIVAEPCAKWPAISKAIQSAK